MQDPWREVESCDFLDRPSAQGRVLLVSQSLSKRIRITECREGDGRRRLLFGERVLVATGRRPSQHLVEYRVSRRSVVKTFELV